MTVKEFAQKLGMNVLSAGDNEDREITGVYVCDLLSWVMSHAEKGNVWITVLTNINVAAVALLTEVSCVVIPEGIEVEEATLNKAREHGIVFLSTDMSAYEVCCRACEIL